MKHFQPWICPAIALALCFPFGLLGSDATTTNRTRLLFVSDANYPPITYVDRGESRGVAVDIMRALAKRMGRAFEIRLMPWQDAQNMVLQGKADAVFPMSITEARKQTFDFSAPILELQFSIFTRSTRSGINGIDDLNGLRVGATAGGLPRQLLEKNPGIKLVTIEDYPQGFHLLRDGSIDAVVADRWVGTFVAAERDFRDVQISGDPIARLTAAVAVRKGDGRVLPAIDAALRAIDSDGTLERITKSWQPKEVVFLTREQMERWGIGIAFGALLLLLGIMGAWMISLRRENAVRRRAENEIAALHQRLSFATRSGRIGIWDWDVPRNILVWDDEMHRIYQVPKANFGAAYEVWSKALHPADRERAQAEVQTALRAEKPFDTQFRILWPDGTVRTIKASAQAFRSADGRPLRMVGVNFDITELTQTEEQLRFSEERFRSALQNSPIGMGLAAPDGRWLEVNPMLCGIVGYTREEMLALDLQSITHPEDLEATRTQLERMRTRQADACQMEQRYVHKDGRIVWIQLNASLICNPDGASRHFVCQIQDITDRKRAETERSCLLRDLREVNERYLRHEAAITTLTRSYAFKPENLPVLLKEITEVVARTLEIERVGIWTYNSARSAVVSFELFERSANQHSTSRELLRAGHEVYFNAMDSADVIAAHQASEDARTASLLDDYLRPHGITSLLNVPLHARGLTMGVLSCEQVGASRNWTSDEQTFAVAVANLVSMLFAQFEQQQLEGQLRQTQKLEALGTLAGGIAHDFNNILGAIISFTELSRMDNPTNRDLQENLQQVLNASNRATNLVRQILSFSRQQKPERTPLQLEPVLREALKLLRSTLPATLEIELNFAPNLPDVLADPTQMHQVVMNLCTNAAQAMQNTQGQLGVALDLFELAEAAPTPHPELRAGNYLRLTVRDSGHGMEQPVLDRIFEPFFTTKKPGEGTGLGLAVVHGIVKDHDGVISAASQPGRGTTFTIYLPAIQPMAEPETEPWLDVPRGRGECILFVDDEPALCEVARRAMTRLGYEPVVHRKAADALQAMRDTPQRFAAVVSDLTMPGMTGLELARKILSVRAETPVILTSGYGMEVTDESVRAAGARALIQKPIDYKALAFAIDAALHASTPPNSSTWNNRPELASEAPLVQSLARPNRTADSGVSA